MIKTGEKSCWPKLRFIENRIKVERVILEGLRRTSERKQDEEFSGHVGDHEVADFSADSDEKGKRQNLRRTKVTDLTRGRQDLMRSPVGLRRQSSLVEEMRRQSAVFFDDEATDGDEEAATTTDEDHVTDEDDETAVPGEENGTRVRATL